MAWLPFINGQHGQSTTRYELSCTKCISGISSYSNRWILCDKNASIALRLKFFDAMVTSVACFAAGHRKVYVGELRKLDVHCRRLLRRMVGAPPDAKWNGPWHEVLHWHPQQGRLGQAFMTWDSPLQHFARWQRLGNWMWTAQDTDLWQHYFHEFCTLILK